MRKPTQIELFPQSSEKHVHQTPSSLIMGKLTLSFESIVVLTIAVVIIMIVSFSLGIEKGKRLTRVDGSLIPEPENIEAEVEVPLHQEEVPPPSKISIPNEIEDIKPLEVAIIQEQEIIKLPEPQGVTLGAAEKNVDKFYTIQVASFKKRKFAQKEAMALKDKGYDIMVVPKGKYSIVCVGKFSLKEDAKIVSQELKKKYKDCLIRRL